MCGVSQGGTGFEVWEIKGLWGWIRDLLGFGGCVLASALA